MEISSVSSLLKTEGNVSEISINTCQIGILLYPMTKSTQAEMNRTSKSTNETSTALGRLDFNLAQPTPVRRELSRFAENKKNFDDVHNTNGEMGPFFDSVETKGDQEFEKGDLASINIINDNHNCLDGSLFYVALSSEDAPLPSTKCLNGNYSSTTQPNNTKA